MSAMTDWETPPLFDLPGEEPREAKTIPARTSDPGTAHAATAAVTVRAGTHRARMLAGFAAYGEGGATDEEAAGAADLLHAEFAKRSSELREAGLVEVLDGVTRPGRAGVQRIVSCITEDGRTTLRRLG